MVSTNGLSFGFCVKYKLIRCAFTISRSPTALRSSKLLKSLLIPIFSSMASGVISLPLGRISINFLISLFTLLRSVPKYSTRICAALGLI